jgi:hypothetical protein
VSVALQLARGGRDVAVQVGLHRGRTTDEDQVLARAEVDHEAGGLERCHFDGLLGDAVATSDHQGVATPADPDPNDTTACVSQRVRHAVDGDQRIRNRPAIPDHLDVDRAILGTEIEVEPLGRAPADAQLAVLEVGRDHLFAAGDCRYRRR